jgi:uncharacterized protein YrzB (UPF0473 family)
MEEMENLENIVVLTDENGEEKRFEIITALEVEEEEYYVLYPADATDDEGEALVLKLAVNENDEDVLVEIEDDDEFEKVEKAYNAWLEDEDDEEGCGCGCGCGDDCEDGCEK